MYVCVYTRSRIDFRITFEYVPSYRIDEVEWIEPFCGHGEMIFL